MRRFTEESVWRKSVDQEDIVEKQLQNKGRSECGTGGKYERLQTMPDKDG